jgi:hypothetical protein
MQMGQVFCIVCGEHNPNYARFCHSCGKSIDLDSSIQSGPGVNTFRQQRVAASPIADASFQISQSLKSNRQPEFEIKPKSVRNGLLAGAGCLLFVIAGGYIMSSGKPEDMLAGGLGVVFFGGVGLIIPMIMLRKVSFVLNSYGIQQIGAKGRAFIGWDDIEKIGVVSMYSNRFVGVRLKSYDNYLASVTPEMANFFRKGLPVMKLVARATSLVDLPGGAATKVVTTLIGTEDTSDVLKSVASIESYTDSLAWNRKHFGYDLLWGWSDRDRSAKKFAALLEEYRAG